MPIPDELNLNRIDQLTRENAALREKREHHESEEELTGRDFRAERFAKMDEADRRPAGT